jgi:hypothetical protein
LAAWAIAIVAVAGKIGAVTVTIIVVAVPDDDRLVDVGVVVVADVATAATPSSFPRRRSPDGRHQRVELTCC